MSYGIGFNSVDLDYFDVTDARLNDMLGAISMNYEDDSPAVTNSSKGSLGINNTPQYTGSGNNMPYPFYPEANSFDSSRQVTDYTSGFP